MSSLRKNIKIIFLICATLSSLFTSTVQALDGEYDPNFYASNGIYYYNPNDVGCVGSSNGDGSGSCTINTDKLADASKSKIGDNISNANSIISKLSSTQIQGYTLSMNQIAAILGNGVTESSLDPSADSGSHRGVWQWDSRFDNGATLGDLDSQINLLIKEMSEGGWADRMAGRGGLESGNFFEMDDIDELTKKFAADFEAAVGGSEGYQALSERQQFAREIRAAIDCTESTQTDSSTESSSIDAKYAAFFDKYHDSAVKAEIEFGLPWEAILVQASIEGDWGQSTLASQYNNHFGIKADNAPNSTGKVTMSTREEVNGSSVTIDADFATYDVENSIPAIGYFLAGNSRYAESGTFNNTTNPEGYFNAIKAAGYATDSSYVSTNMSRLNTLLKPHIKDRGWKDSAEIASENPQALENAKKYANGAEVSDTSSSSSASKCETSSNSGLISGGMTLNQAGEFMKSYYEKSDSDSDITSNTVGAYGGCAGGLKANCVSFSTYFINKYTNLNFTKTDGGGPGNGIDVVGNLISRNPSIEFGDTPKAYSVFSAPGTSPEGHTGIILGIDKDRNVAIIGEANCGLTGFSVGGYAGVGAREQSIDDMDGWKFAYVENNLSGDIAYEK